MNEFKNSMDKIVPSDELKDKIYENIMQKASEPAPVIRVKFNNYVKVAMVAMFAVGFFAIYSQTHQNTPVVPRSISTFDNQEPVQTNLEVYFVHNNTLSKQVISDCPSDPVLAWDKFLELKLFDKEILLENYSYEDNILTLYFNPELKLEVDNGNTELLKAIEKTYQNLYPEQKNIIIN